MMKTHQVVIPQDPKARRIAEYVVKQRDDARLGESVMVPAYMAADLLKIVDELENRLRLAGALPTWRALSPVDIYTDAVSGHDLRSIVAGNQDSDHPNQEVR